MPACQSGPREGVGGGALVYLGLHQPELRLRIAALITELFEREDEDTVFLAFLAMKTAAVDDPIVRGAMAGAFARGAVEPTIATKEEAQHHLLGEPWRDEAAQLDLMTELLTICRP